MTKKEKEILKDIIRDAETVVLPKDVLKIDIAVMGRINQYLTELSMALRTGVYPPDPIKLGDDILMIVNTKAIAFAEKYETKKNKKKQVKRMANAS